VLGFTLVDDRRRTGEPYVYLRLGDAFVGAVRAWLPVEPALRSVPHGAELVRITDRRVP